MTLLAWIVVVAVLSSLAVMCVDLWDKGDPDGDGD